jgi:hypothetical protein
MHDWIAYGIKGRPTPSAAAMRVIDPAYAVADFAFTGFPRKVEEDE